MSSLNGGYGFQGPSTQNNKIPKGYSYGQLDNYTPQQQQLSNQQFGYVGPESYLSKLAGGDQSQFAQTEAPALRQFSEMQGNIASRFSGMGSGARNSSGFQNTQNSAASNFSQQLQSQRMGYRNQAIQDLMSMSNRILGQKQYDQFLTEKPKPWWQEAATGLAQGLGQGASKLGMSSFLG